MVMLALNLVFCSLMSYVFQKISKKNPPIIRVPSHSLVLCKPCAKLISLPWLCKPHCYANCLAGLISS